MLNVDLFAIDPQQSFTDPNGSLFVPGGDADMNRLANFIGDITPRLNRLHISLDQHHVVDISHPHWFASEHGDPAKAITIMSYDDARDLFVGFCPVDNTTIEYRTRKRQLHSSTRDYIKALKAAGRYDHTIWPEHCLIGTAGGTVNPVVMDAAQAWARQKVATINFVAKGSNPFTEHFSAVKAEVPQNDDPSTQLNTGLIQVLDDADILFLTGEALSHCVANTGRDIVAEFDADSIKKIVLLTDCCSNVPGFEALGTQFITDMTALGMRAMTCSDAKALLS